MSTTQWREPIAEPSSIDFGPDLKLEKVLGYPHAGNDVFFCQGSYQDKAIQFYLKLARHKDANLANEAKALTALQTSSIPVPQVLAYGNIPCEYLAISSMEGQRMSGPLTEPHWKTARENIHPHLIRIAQNLANIHAINMDWEPVRPRTQFHIPTLDTENPSHKWLQDRIEWLKDNQPQQQNRCFVHGDHHYANLLWMDGEISATLDWELCGIGWREFDLAWSALPRPGQKFFNTMEQQETFLNAYGQHCTFDRSAFIWCFALIAVHFMSIKPLWDEREYHALLEKLAEEFCQN